LYDDERALAFGVHPRPPNIIIHPQRRTNPSNPLHMFPPRYLLFSGESYYSKGCTSSVAAFTKFLVGSLLEISAKRPRRSHREFGLVCERGDRPRIFKWGGNVGSTSGPGVQPTQRAKLVIEVRAKPPPSPPAARQQFPRRVLLHCGASRQVSQIPKKHTDERKKAFFGGQTWDRGTFTLAYLTHQLKPDLCMGRRPLGGAVGPEFKRRFPRDFTFFVFCKRK